MFTSTPNTNLYNQRIDIVHTIYRTIQDLKKLRHTGVRTLISSIVLPIAPTSGKTYNDFFEWLCTEEVKRCEQLNIKLQPVIGIPPSKAVMNPKIVDEALVYLEDFLRNKKAIGIGEIGMGYGSKQEYVAFKRQLTIASKFELPVIVQAPQRDKVALTSIILKELKKAKINKAIIDHCDIEVLKLIIRDPNEDIKIGLTVGQEALKPKEALEIFKNYSYDKRIILDSGLGISQSWIWGQTETIELMEQDRIREESIQRLVYDNYIDVFPRLSQYVKFTD